MMPFDDGLAIDRQHIWHPYSAIGSNLPIFPVVSANGVRLRLADGRELIDGMASWWSVIHGYNHPELNQAVTEQLSSMAHVMFGGLTHMPAIKLAKLLVEITPPKLQTVFFADSGSVSVDVAMKMAIQYWSSQHLSNKQQFITIRNGYHGDTLGSMSVCDPDTGMHSLFTKILAKQYFVDAPQSPFGAPCHQHDINQMEHMLATTHQDVAAVILEPIVQGAGGMRFYSADYLYQLRQLCDQYKVLLILDEIATGFGRTGKLFACEHANVEPDIMCIGKALTGGYMTLAATLSSEKVSQTISEAYPGVFMHGPTFMANPLACAVALKSIQLLLNSPWQAQIKTIEARLKKGLAACRTLSVVKEVRVLGAIGVVEMHKPIDMLSIQPQFVEHGVWIRPFGKLVYIMPPYIINKADLEQLTNSIFGILSKINGNSL